MLNSQNIPKGSIDTYDTKNFKELLLQEQIPLETIEIIENMQGWGGVNFLDLLWNDINNNEVQIHEGRRQIKMVSMICQDQVNQLLLTKIHGEAYSKYSLSGFVPGDNSGYVANAIREIKEESGYDIFPEEVYEIEDVNIVRESPKLPGVETLTQGKIFKVNYAGKFDIRKRFHDGISDGDEVNHDVLITKYGELIQREDINPTYLKSLKEHKKMIRR